MFENLKEHPADKILALMQTFRDDPRDDNVDLGVGVFRNAQGATPVMQAVKQAEQRLWQQETTKSYVGLTGDPAFADAMIALLLGDAVARARIAAAATPGGTGAVRQGLELIRMAQPDATVWVSDPTWPNHLSILKHLGVPTRPYRYFDNATGGVDFDGMCADLEAAHPGDVVLLHGCCHNPTGANPTMAQWAELIAQMQEQGLTPFVDIAYQGFGDGLEDDAAGLRMVASEMPETLIAASCSKNFGIYRERAGILLAVGDAGAARDLTQGNLAYLNRQNFSFPPDHGARLVTMILTDAELRAMWQEELEQMRRGMLDLRRQLAEELRRRSNSERFDFLAEHRGMFSRLGTTPENVEKLRRDHGIYLVGDSRMNIAGLNAETVPHLARAIVDAGI
ncbi:amino acid aminotransferase [Brevirhabdus sp.]|uniref:amino acid aminotransferase n=1 Tax=Brevirhabdus sp. TaxID=2004514 RepID=UPI00405A3AE5